MWNRLPILDDEVKIVKKIAVIGSMSMDLVVQTEVVPGQGETVLGHSFKTFCGGKGANQAIAAARAGLEVIMIGAVGQDSFGKVIKENLEENLINTEFIKEVKESASGSAHITINEGDNRIVVVPGANSLVSMADVRSALTKHPDIELIILQNEIPLAINQEILALATSLSIKTLYNPAPALAIEQTMIEEASYLTPNEHEFKLLFPEASLKSMLERYSNKLLVTQGSKGVIFASDTAIENVLANKVTNVVDTTGAGDTFNGYFAKGIMSQLSVEDSIKLGNIAASIAIQFEGAQDGIPTLSQVKEHEGYEEKWDLK